MVHVINALGVGGAEALLYRLVSKSSVIDQRVICLRGRDWYSSLIEASGIPLEHLEIGRGASALARSWRLGRFIRDLRPDVIQAWMYGANLSAGFWAKAFGIPIVWGIHHSTLGTLRWQSRILVYLGGFFARMIPSMVVNCSTRSASVHAMLGYGAAPGIVIHNGYDPEEFYPDEISRATVRQLLDVSDEIFLVGSIGRWHPQKDIPNLLSAIKLVRERGASVSCLLVGSNLNSKNRELSAAIDAAEVSDIVEALGKRSDVVELARAIDLHVLASADGEAFPNVVAETMLSGTPNVTTDVGDVALMVGETGWVVPPRYPEQLADAIEQAYREWKESPDTWRERRIRARQQIAGNFTFEMMARAYEEVWRDVAERRRSDKPV